MATSQRPLETIFITQLAIQLEQHTQPSPPASPPPPPPASPPRLASLLIPLRRLLQRLAPRLARAARLHRAVSVALAPMAQERWIRRHLGELRQRMTAMEQLEEAAQWESAEASDSTTGWLGFYQCADRLLSLAQQARADSALPRSCSAAAAASDVIVAMRVANNDSTAPVDPLAVVPKAVHAAAAAATAAVRQARELRSRGVYSASVATCLQRLLDLLPGEVDGGGGGGIVGSDRQRDCQQRLCAAVRDYTAYGERVCGIHCELLHLARQLSWESGGSCIGNSQAMALLILPSLDYLESAGGSGSCQGHLIVTNSQTGHARQEPLSTDTLSVIQAALAGNRRSAGNCSELLDDRCFDKQEWTDAVSRENSRMQTPSEEPVKILVDPLIQAESPCQKVDTLTSFGSSQLQCKPSLIATSPQLTSTAFNLPPLLLTQNHQHHRQRKQPQGSEGAKGSGGGVSSGGGSIRHRWAQESFESLESGGASLVTPFSDASSSAALAAAIEVPEPPPCDGSEVGGDKAALVATVTALQRAYSRTVVASQPDLASTHTTETSSDSPEEAKAAAVAASAEARRLRRARQSTAAAAAAAEAGEKKAKRTSERGAQADDRPRRKPEKKLLLVQLERRDQPVPHSSTVQKTSSSTKQQQTGEEKHKARGVKSKSRPESMAAPSAQQALLAEVADPAVLPTTTKPPASNRRRKAKRSTAVTAEEETAATRPDTASNSDAQRRQQRLARRTVVEILKPEIGAPRLLPR